MRILVSRLFLPIACAAALAGAVVWGESPPARSGTATPLVFSDPVPADVQVPLWPEPDTSHLRYYSSLYWHDNRFVALYMLSEDKKQAQVALEFNRRFLEDALKLPRDQWLYDVVLCQTYARLAWMAKDSGDEAEYQRLAAEAVFRLRRWELLNKGVDKDPARWPVELQAAKTAPPINTELYDVLYMVLVIDRYAEVAWIKESSYDFDGFLKTLKEDAL